MQPRGGGVLKVVRGRSNFKNHHSHTWNITFAFPSGDGAAARPLVHPARSCTWTHLEDVTTALANAARLGLGSGTLCADVVESRNTILKWAYNHHTAGAGCQQCAL